jgi:hypothetical protein
MPTPKSSEKANTTEKTDKIFSPEQVKNLSIRQLIDMKKEGWRHAEDPPPWGSVNYQAPGFDPAKDLISPSDGTTYVAGTVPKLPTAATPELEALRADPEMQKMAAKMGVSVDDLVLLRQMSLDKYGGRYNPPPQAESAPGENT